MPIVPDPPVKPVAEVENDPYENLALTISKSDFVLGDTIELIFVNPNKVSLEAFDISIQDTLVIDGGKFSGGSRKVRIAKKGKLKVSVQRAQLYKTQEIQLSETI